MSCGGAYNCSNFETFPVTWVFLLSNKNSSLSPPASLKNTPSDAVVSASWVASPIWFGPLSII